MVSFVLLVSSVQALKPALKVSPGVFTLFEKKPRCVCRNLLEVSRSFHSAFIVETLALMLTVLDMMLVQEA